LLVFVVNWSFSDLTPMSWELATH